MYISKRKELGRDFLSMACCVNNAEDHLWHQTPCFFFPGPLGICGISVKHSNTTSATLTWDPTTSGFTHYRILLSNLTSVWEFNISGGQAEYTVTHLLPGGIYNFTIQRMKGSVAGDPASVLAVAGLFSFLSLIM